MLRALAVSADNIIAPSESERLSVLAKLEAGAGVTVITGPEGKEWWGLASVEIVVKVELDGYVFKDRFGSRLEWALRNVGVSSGQTKAWLKKPPVKAKKQWQDAQELLAKFEAEALSAKPLIEVEYDVEIRENPPVVSLGEPIAVDWEWHEDTRKPIGFSCAELGRVVWVQCNKCNNGLGERRWFSDLVHARRGPPVVMHGGRGDLATQYLGDPAELTLAGSSIDDTMIMAFIMGEEDLGLKPLTRKFLGREPMEYPPSLASLPVATQARYAGADARNTLDLYPLFVNALIMSDQWKVYTEFEAPLVPVIASMEKYGTPVNMEKVIRYYGETVTREQGMRRFLQEEFGCDPASDAGGRGILTKALGFDPGTLDQRIISQYPSPIIDLVLYYRRQRTLRRSFFGTTIERWLVAGKPRNFVVYPRFNQAARPDKDDMLAPGTGRLSSSDPNLQQQPQDIRDIYVPPEGYLWWKYDYAQIELRIAAALSKDPTMLEMFRRGVDIHIALQDMAQAITGVRPERVLAKRWNFGKLYRAKLPKLIEILATDKQNRMHVDIGTARAMDKAHASMFPTYPKWAGQEVREARKRGYGLTYFGRRRLLPGLESTSDDVRWHAESAAVNHAVQGTAADVIKKAMIAVQPVLAEYDGHLAIQNHDELAGWVRESVNLVRFHRDMLEILEVTLAGVRLTVEGGVGKDWGNVG